MLLVLLILNVLSQRICFMQNIAIKYFLLKNWILVTLLYLYQFCITLIYILRATKYKTYFMACSFYILYNSELFCSILV